MSFLPLSLKSLALQAPIATPGSSCHRWIYYFRLLSQESSEQRAELLTQYPNPIREIPAVDQLKSNPLPVCVEPGESDWL